MKKPLTKFAKFMSEKIYKHFGENSGNMLLATSIIGILTSCIAQTGAICLNKKYTSSQKMFMIPQELTEGCIAALSIFFITKPIQKFANKCFNSGKILSKDMVEYLKKNNLSEKRGDANFDFKTSVLDIIHKIESSDKFIKSSKTQQTEFLAEHRQILNEFDTMADAASAYAATFAGITASAFVSPLLRNHVASKFQNAGLKYIEESSPKTEEIKQSTTFKSRYTYPTYSHYNRI